MGTKNNSLQFGQFHPVAKIEHICYLFNAVIQLQTETTRTLTSEECRPASRIATP